jgi:hypothetical protein
LHLLGIIFLTGTTVKREAKSPRPESDLTIDVLIWGEIDRPRRVRKKQISDTAPHFVDKKLLT